MQSVTAFPGAILGLSCGAKWSFGVMSAAEADEPVRCVKSPDCERVAAPNRCRFESVVCWVSPAQTVAFEPQNSAVSQQRLDP